MGKYENIEQEKYDSHQIYKISKYGNSYWEIAILIIGARSYMRSAREGGESENGKVTVLKKIYLRVTSKLASNLLNWFKP